MLRVLSLSKEKVFRSKTILITRPRHQAGRLRCALEDLGARVIEHPTIEIRPVRDFRVLDRAISKISDFDFLVLTSENGVSAFLDRFRKLKMNVSRLRGVRVAAIGPRTAQALARAGIKTHLLPRVFSTAGLLAAFRKKKWIRGKKFLLLRADIAPPDLRRELEKGGARVSEVPVYRTRFCKSASARLRRIFRSCRVDYVLFTSASTARGFFDMLGAQTVSEMRFISIGPVTSRAIRSFGAKVFREARTHNMEGLVQALVSLETSERAEKTGKSETSEKSEKN